VAYSDERYATIPTFVTLTFSEVTPMKSHSRIPELLAPAGSVDALYAAIANGADAVYLGIDRLNARRGAENFTLETLADACRFAHLRGRRVYLTLNIAVLAAEMNEALEVVAAAWSAGVDAVIVQDVGLLSNIRTLLPQVRVHASTQLNAHSSATVAALADAGVARVTLARETSLVEIGRLAAAGAERGVETESFVHGALCVCYSGQCLLSSLIGGRSANRGLCAQPCRLAYQLVDSGGVELADVGAHLLSPKDLAGIALLPELIASGVASLKIEGRMKSPEYVALVTGVYRQALDRAATDPDSFGVRDGEWSVLSEAFSRGFAEAYLSEQRGNEIMSYQRPNNRGVPLGRVVTSESRTATIQLDATLESGDTIEVWTSRGRFAQTVDEITADGGLVSTAPRGSKVSIALDEPVAVGDRVFRVRNSSLMSAAQRSFDQGAASAPLATSIAVRVVLGEPVSVTLSLESGETVTASGAVVEPARTKSVTTEEVIEHVGRLGGTPFVPASWDVVLSPGAGIGFSELHRVRREAVESMETALLAPWAARRVSVSRLKRRGIVEAPRGIRIAAVVADEQCARAALDAGADEAHVPVWALEDAEPTVGIVPILLRIDHDRDAEHTAAIASRFGRAVAGTLGQLRRCSRDGVLAQSHWSLNVVNPWSADVLAAMGAGTVWLSPELSAEQIGALSATVSVPLGTAVLGRQELMVTEHCVLMSEGPCAQACASCKRRRDRRYLLDRKGYRFPVMTDPTGRTHLFNSVPLDLLSVMGEVRDAGVSAVRLDLETLDVSEIAGAVRRAVAALDAPQRAQGTVRDATTTTGHFYRGVR
jgi:putative protease